MNLPSGPLQWRHSKTLADGLQSISLSNDILFAFDAVDLREAAAPTLNLVAQKLRRDQSANIRIEGHSDGIGSAVYNQALSERRATAVRNWLVELGKVEADRIEVLGLGEMKPLLPKTKPDGSDDSEARQTNRRVEILIQK